MRRANAGEIKKEYPTDQVPRETSMKVPTAQLLATNGSVPTPMCEVSPYPASAKRGTRGKRDQGTGRRTNAETTYDTNADSTRDPAQETVPRARNFANTLQVIGGRQSLLVVPTRAERVSKKPNNQQKGLRREREGRKGVWWTTMHTLNASRTSVQ